MRSYKNSKGDIVHVSKEHLDTAVRIKLELQKASPSRKTSWKLHKQLMEAEGFFDSDTNEAYRCLIKDYQKSIGALPSAQEHVEMVANSKLESIKELVGELAWEKRENQNVLRELNKTKREIIDKGLMIESVSLSTKNVLSEIRFKEIIKSFEFKPVALGGKTRLILVITDWHIGALVDIEGNKYNYEIAVQRIDKLLDKVFYYAVTNNVFRIDVVYCGDMLEHAYMRPSQAYNAEFPVSEQITRGARLIIEVLMKLSKHFFVTYCGFAGNHDRLEGDKNKVIRGDNAMVVVNEIVKVFIETANIENLMYKHAGKFHAQLLDVNGRNFKFVHGDKERKSDRGKLADHSARDGIIYDAIVMGHFHHFDWIEVADDKFEIFVGSLKGADEHTEDLGLASSPSQAIILVNEHGEIDVQRIKVA
jgi:hypothetical protein